VIVERARQFLTKEKERVEDLIMGIHETRAALEKERAEAAQLRAQAQQLKQEYDAKYGGAQKRAEEALEKARAQAAQVLAQARREAEAVIDELKAAAKKEREAERTQAIQSARGRLTTARQSVEGHREPKVRRPAEAPKGLKLGDSVHVLSLDQTGYVLSEPDASGNVVVQVGILKITVPLLELARAEEPAAEPAKKGSGTRSMARGATMAKAREISTEVDLRGLTVDEALEKVDKYLDDASLAGAPSVRIIHGKGTGALRKAVTDHLKYHRLVSSYRLGGLGEGGDGVTVAKLSE